jgi:L-ribulose-5-phosphate 4-epimerase
MSWSEERQILCDAGRTLLQKGLVARTWGNLSLRVDSGHFLITPSGRTYDSVRPEDVALVNLADLSWEGLLKPSSETELHARVYRNRPEIHAIVHTHQPAASSLAASRHGFLPSRPEDIERVGKEVVCVPYSLPTTRSLAAAVERAVTGTAHRALLLSNHGALCLAHDMRTALQRALDLEEISENHVLECFRRETGIQAGGRDEMLKHYAGGAGSERAITPADHDRYISVALDASPKIQTAIIHTGPYAAAAGRAGRTVRPMLDDLAQLIGPSLPCAATDARIRRVLTRRAAVLLPSGACLCAAATPADAEAVAMVAEKGCRVAIESSYLGGGHTISYPESLLMRRLYLAKYSKKAAE